MWATLESSGASGAWEISIQTQSASSTPTWTTRPQAGYQINSTAISGDGGVCLFGTSREFGSGQFAVYCHAGDGSLMWSAAIGERSYQGVFWVALSDDGSHAAAGGSLGSEDQVAGFLRAWSTHEGAPLLQRSLPQRVNQVALSARGEVLVAVAGDRVYVHALTRGRYVEVAVQHFAGGYLRSCAVSADGHHVLLGGSREHAATGRKAVGLMAMYRLRDGSLDCRSLWSSPSEVLHVAMLADASWWAGSRDDGKASAFQHAARDPNQPAWTGAPPGMTLGSAYGLAIARHRGRVRVVCGANVPDQGHGCLYALESADDTAVAGAGDPPHLLWSRQLQYDPNPGISLDRTGMLGTATDGQPQCSGGETPGNFYLYHGHDGALVWRYPTPLMNWPMGINSLGNAVFAASDDGMAYYWKLT